MTDTETQSETRPRAARGLVLLAGYIAIVGWSFHAQSTSWPHEGSWAMLAYLFLVPGILFQSWALAYARRTGRPLTRRALTRVVTIPLGIVLAALLQEWASALALDEFKRAYAPFVAQVRAELAEPCGGSARYFAIPAVAAYNDATSRRPAANLKYDSKRFVLSFSGGSIDIDGSTIYYDSGAKAWRKFHNDSETRREALDKLTEGLAACRLQSVQVSQ